jgi:enolase
MVDYWDKLVSSYPIISIEDGLAEEDWDGWRQLTERLGSRCSSLATTSLSRTPKRLRRGIELGAANALLVKVNQIGTLTETLEAMQTAQRARYTTIVSPPFGRDRGHHDRRPGRCHQRRPDQDRCARPL